MQAVQTAPKAIRLTVGPTSQAFLPLLLKNKDAILARPPQTHSYGSLDRHKLDLYKAQGANSARAPIVVFLYGGGLVNGGRSNPMSQGLVYANIGHFFSSRGFNLVIPDYRLVPAHLVTGGAAPEGKAGGGEPAAYPSGAEDLSLALQWISKNLASEADVSRIFAIGNSAGGLHLGTFLFDTDFYLSDSSGMAELRKALKLAVLLAPPPDFQSAEEERFSTLEAYYGSRERVEKLCIASLLRDLPEDQVKRLPKILDLMGELDPAEVTEANDRFAEIAKHKGADFKLAYLAEAKGGFKHNHLSPPFSLSSGEGEEWAEQLVELMKSL